MCNKEVDDCPWKLAFFYILTWKLAYVPDHFKTQEMCNEAVHIELHSFAFVPDDFKTQEMWNEIMCTMPVTFHRNPDSFKTQEMCIKVVEVDPPSLMFVTDHLKTQDIFIKAVENAGGCPWLVCDTKTSKIMAWSLVLQWWWNY